MGENRKKILQMLADKKISVEEAERLLSLIGPDAKDSEAKPPEAGTKPLPKHLYVIVEPKEGAHPEWHGRVNVRIPFGLIRAGMKLSALVPPQAADKVNDALKEKGFTWDMRHFTDEDIENLVTALRDSEVNIQSDGETVRVYTE